MSNFKFSTGLLLEKAELERFKKFLQEDGYINYFLQNSVKFGLVKNDIDNTFNNGKITEGASLSINQAEINAFDSSGNFIYKASENNITVPNDSAWYWVKISHQVNNQETGTYSIDVNGNLVCTSADGELLSILRGQPNFPSRVKLIDSVSNTLEYDVLEVVDDNNAVLQGSFVAESDLKLVVVGTFFLAVGFTTVATF